MKRMQNFKFEKLLVRIAAVIAAAAIVTAIGAFFFQDSSLKAAEHDIAAETQETVSSRPEVVVEELIIELP